MCTGQCVNRTLHTVVGRLLCTHVCTWAHWDHILGLACVVPLNATCLLYPGHRSGGSLRGGEEGGAGAVLVEGSSSTETTLGAV